MKKPTPKGLVAHEDGFIQSRNIKEAQQYLWEGSLAHNADAVVQLKMAVWHLESEIAHREACLRLGKANPGGQ